MDDETKQRLEAERLAAEKAAADAAAKAEADGKAAAELKRLQADAQAAADEAKRLAAEAEAAKQRAAELTQSAADAVATGASEISSVLGEVRQLRDALSAREQANRNDDMIATLSKAGLKAEVLALRAEPGQPPMILSAFAGVDPRSAEAVAKIEAYRAANPGAFTTRQNIADARRSTLTAVSTESKHPRFGDGFAARVVASAYEVK